MPMTLISYFMQNKLIALWAQLNIPKSVTSCFSYSLYKIGVWKLFSKYWCEQFWFPLDREILYQTIRIKLRIIWITWIWSARNSSPANNMLILILKYMRFSFFVSYKIMWVLYFRCTWTQMNHHQWVHVQYTCTEHLYWLVCLL